MSEATDTTSISVMGSYGLGNGLLSLLMADDIQPGSDISYELCKTIYSYHPLGQKMAEAPLNMAQSQKRQLSVQEAPPEVLKEFEREWDLMGASARIHDLGRLARVYGLASVVAGCTKVPADKPLDMTKIHEQDLFFNVLDPLNTAGSLVLSQIPTAKDFNKPVSVVTNGVRFHPSRYVVLMNEAPVYLQYTDSAFGFVGRSVYQRALFPLKSFIRSMIADDMIATKLALLVAKQKSPGSIATRAMAAMQAVKRSLLRQAQTGQVLSIDTTEGIETLNMQNVDGAGTYSRTNILKNTATSGDMPAKLLENETMVAGFGEGTEDAKNIARYIERVREWLGPAYAWFDNFVQYRAWNGEFYARIQHQYPEAYGKVPYEEAFSRWRQNFAAQWPSLLIEPESEEIKVDDVKLQAVIAVLQTLLPVLDPANKTLLIQSALDNVSENRRMFAHEFELDYDALEQFFTEQATQAAANSGEQNGSGGTESVGPEAKKFGRFDSQPSLAALRDAVARLPARKHAPAKS